MNVLQCCISLLFVSHAAHSFCEDNCVDRLCSQCKVGYLEPDCCDCQFDYFRVGNQTCCSAEVSIYSSNRVCNDRCEEDGSVTCLRCNTDYEEPFCCECRHNTRQSSSGACIIQHFLPYDVTNGDQILPSEDDGSFGLMKISVPLNFFNTFQTHLYVSTNGLISFINEFSSYIPEPLSNFFPFPIIAPLWMDLNPVDAGLVYYRTTMNASILERVVEMITDINSNYSDYRPSLAVIVTWDDVPLISNHFKRVSFQVVLSTDGKTSFAALLYSQFTVDLISSPCNRLPFLIGFTAGDGRRFTNIPNVLNKINVFRIDGECITSVLPSDVCPLRSMNFECGSSLNASSCVCDEGFQSPMCTEFFTFGESRGDSVGPHAVDESFQISIPLPIVFFQKKETTLHVSTNGIISFQYELLNSFNTLPFPSSDVPLIAPLWADFDFREIGTIFYRVSQDEIILNHFSRLLTERNPNFSSYYPTLCVIVTWYSATHSSLEFEETTATFQVVLATDGKASFAVLIYDDPSRIMSNISNINGIIGFDAGDQFRSATIISRRNRNNSILNKTNIFRIDGNCITSISTGASCVLNSTSLQCNGFAAFSCLCEESALSRKKCRLTDFLHFGIVNGDSVGPRAVDESSDPIVIDIPIVFFLKNQTNIFVSTNGLVSFENEFTSHLVTAFPRTVSPFVPIVAPFWADFNFRKAGSIYYRATSDNFTLNLLSDIILYFKGYSPTLSVIVTWFQGHVFRFNFVIDVQLILLTDGTASYAVFIYGSIKGSIQDNKFEPVIGFDTGDKKNGESIFSRIIFSNITGDINNGTIFRIDGNCIVLINLDTCQSNSVPIWCDSLSSTTCLCNAGIRSTESNPCLEFLQFGGRAGDDIIPLPNQPTVTTKNISLSTPLVFYQKRVSTLNVSVDGLITINSSSSLPMKITPLLIPVLVTARSTDKRTLYYRVIKDDMDSLEEVTAIITGFNPDLTNFRPLLAVVTTWLFDDENHTLRTCVQSILCTDGDISFVIFLYENPEILYNISKPDPVVNFDAGDLIRRVIIADINYTLEMRNVFRIDGKCITTASPGKVCGLNSVTSTCDNSLTATNCICHFGYEHEDELNCKDINECEVGTHNCTQTCNNTEGGYICTCRDGYQLDNSDNGTCIESDIAKVSSGSDVSLVVGLSSLSLLIPVLAVVAVIIILLYIKRKKKRDLNFEHEESQHNSDYSVHSSFKHNLPRSLLFNYGSIDLGKTIGQGEFGIVYKSKLKKNSQITEIVAVKTLKGFVQKEVVKDLLKECVKMSKFDHPNVLKLIGVCLDGGPAPYMIMPFMENGSLLSYLQRERESLLLEPGSLDSDGVNVQKKLMDMCIQIAEGMEYLASNKVVHRDLAARNCMIDVHFVIKVADFGLSEAIDTAKEYYRQSDDVIIKLPIKWLALESINDGVFSEKSDVWSYGVTCWEIFSGGKTPYPGINPIDLPYKLESGFRMEKPLNAACSEDIYSTIKDCWKRQAELRPSFTDLVTNLSSHLSTLADYLDISSTHDVVVEIHTSNEDKATIESA